MKLLKNISVFRILAAYLIAIYFNSLFVDALLVSYFLISKKYKETLIFLVLLSTYKAISLIGIDLIPFGVVEKQTYDGFIVNKILYKTKISSSILKIGDIVKTSDYIKISEITELKKNIRFINNSFEIISNIKIKNITYNAINQYDGQVLDALNKFIYNENNYNDLTFNLGYGLASYYLIKILVKKNKVYGIIFIILYSCLFYFDVKFILIILDVIFNNKNSLFYKIYVISIYNVYLFNNYSILIPILLNLYRYIDLDCDFKTYISFIQSYFFGSINIITTLIFKYIIYIQIFLFVFSILLLIVPSLNLIYLFFIQIYSCINNISLIIRGKISIIGFIIYLLITKLLNIKNLKIKYLFLLLILISPLNDPFMSVNFIDAGQGDATLIKLPLSTENILIDTGSNYNYYKLKKYLYEKSIYKIDYLIITHDDSDHNGNMKNLKKDFKIVNCIDNGEDIECRYFELKNLDLGNYDNDNDNSLVYLANINNLNYLFTGDISSTAERSLIKKYGSVDIDVLKVSHHGSKTATSDYFVSNTLPRIASISTSGQYNHPSKETIDTLSKYNVMTLITKQVGNIEIYCINKLNLLKTGNKQFVIIK